MPRLYQLADKIVNRTQCTVRRRRVIGTDESALLSITPEFHRVIGTEPAGTRDELRSKRSLLEVQAGGERSRTSENAVSKGWRFDIIMSRERGESPEKRRK